MPEPERAEQFRRSLAQVSTGKSAWSKPGALALIGALLGSAVCFVLALGSVSALGRPHKASTAVLAILAAVFAVGAVLLARAAFHVEHRMRAGAPPAPVARTSPRVGRRPPRNSPASRFVTGVVLVVVLGLLVFLSVFLHARAARSAYTQHHGVLRTGTVETVHPIHHSSRSSSWTTYNYGVALLQPVGAVDHTVVNDPTKDEQAFEQGGQIVALVDPKQPSYAEIAGEPVFTSSWFIAPLVLGLVLLFFAFLVGYEQILHRRHKVAA